MLICETCDRKFVNRLALNSHLRSQIHQGTSKKQRVARPQCDKTFSCRQNVNRHTREIHDYVGHKSVKQCSLCPFKTKFILQLSLHFKKVHNQYIHRICCYCITAFEDTESLYSQQEEMHGLPRPITALKDGDKQHTTTAINGSLKVYTMMGTEEEDLFEFMMDKKEEINNILIQNTVRNSQEVQFCATVQLEKPIPDDDGLKIFVRSNTQPVYKEGLKDEEYLEMLEKMLGILYTFTASGSGWMVVKIVQLEIRVVLFTPMTGSSYIALPHQLQSSNSLLNIRNHGDHNCFMYCFTAAWHRKHGPALTPPGQHPRIKRTDPRTYSNANPVAHQPRGEFDMLMGLGQIPLFEEINRCRINIFQ